MFHKFYLLFRPLFLWWLNYVVEFIPCLFLRKIALKMYSAKLGNKSIIDLNCYFLGPENLSIGKHSHINRGCMIDSRGGVVIGNNVSISHCVCICSTAHNCNSPSFDYISAPIVIDDNVWIGLKAIILKGVHIGEGAVVAAGSVVTHDLEPYSIYAGIPAKKIGERNKQINYNCSDFIYYKNIRIPYFQ